MVGLAYPLIIRIIRLAKAQNITSIADFIAARYGKSQAVAATVALIAIVGMIPYIALQLKAVSASVGTILAAVSAGSGAAEPLLGDIALFVAFLMAAFAVLFGTRHIDATEHQDGLMLAVATESIDQARRLSRRRHLCHLRDVPRAARAVCATRCNEPRTAAVLTRMPPFDHLPSPRPCSRCLRSCCCRGNSMSAWSRTTAKPKSAAPPGCFRSISS